MANIIHIMIINIIKRIVKEVINETETGMIYDEPCSVADALRHKVNKDDIACCDKCKCLVFKHLASVKKEVVESKTDYWLDGAPPIEVVKDEIKYTYYCLSCRPKKSKDK